MLALTEERLLTHTKEKLGMSPKLGPGFMESLLEQKIRQGRLHPMQRDFIPQIVVAPGKGPATPPGTPPESSSHGSNKFV